MTYTTTVTFAFNEGSNITNQTEWLAIVDNYATPAERASYKSDVAANADIISSTFQYNGNEVIKTVVWTDQAASDAHTAKSSTAAMIAAFDSMAGDSIVKVFAGAPS